MEAPRCIILALSKRVWPIRDPGMTVQQLILQHCMRDCTPGNIAEAYVSEARWWPGARIEATFRDVVEIAFKQEPAAAVIWDRMMHAGRPQENFLFSDDYRPCWD